jgi:hypothetical protein
MTEIVLFLLCHGACQLEEGFDLILVKMGACNCVFFFRVLNFNLKELFGHSNGIVSPPRFVLVVVDSLV